MQAGQRVRWIACARAWRAGGRGVCVRPVGLWAGDEVNADVHLDAALDWPAAHAVHFSPERRDHACRERVVEAEGVANGEDVLADAEIVRRSDGNGWRHSATRLRDDAQHGEAARECTS